VKTVIRVVRFFNNEVSVDLTAVYTFVCLFVKNSMTPMVEISSMYDAKTSFIELEYALNSRALLIKYISYFVTSSTP